MIFKDTETFPHLLGGPNKTGQNFWTDQPYAKTIDGALMFSLITMGYHLEELVDHVIIQERANDFHEMILHHLATVTLYGGMIVNNAVNPGATIAFVFMIADVPVTFVKFFSQTNLTTCTAASFFCLLPCWFWTRLVIVPWFTYSVHLYYTYPG
jgi:TLC domain